MATWLLMTPFFLYLAWGVASTWLGGWCWLTFAYGSPLFALLVAIWRGERWPLAHPVYSFFFLFPAILILLGGLVWPMLGLMSQPVVDWMPWIGAGLGGAAILTGITGFTFKHGSRPRGALATTFAVASVFGVSLLEAANSRLPQNELVVEQAFVKSARMGGYRQLGPSLTVERVGPYRSDVTLGVSYDTYNSDKDGKATCLHVYSGGLGWRWAALCRCTDPELVRLGVLSAPANEQAQEGETR
ncbi:MAG: hypothetical protein FD124_3452 [Alphaproteobacteria bacterium]|nr:MAG: hypothetical protein FD160_3729 [Caulobacteraceae bacterium]TPW02263.1 MAG: hypothetical protein FD124_3452 [Alphaproteobacteria bacterium]